MPGQINRLSPLFVCLALAACATGPAPSAPQPLKPIKSARFFTGRWYEIARTPVFIVHHCVAGTTDFVNTPNNQLVERDACRRHTPEGSEKVFTGPVEILNPGENTKFVVHYTLFGFIPVPQTYWVLDHGKDYGWFIVSTPSFAEVAILDRNPRPGAPETAVLTARTRALGYDTAKLEYPPEFPPGQD